MSELSLYDRGLYREMMVRCMSKRVCIRGRARSLMVGELKSEREIPRQGETGIGERIVEKSREWEDEEWEKTPHEFLPHAGWYFF